MSLYTGVDFGMKTLCIGTTIGGDKDVKLLIWDTTGSERFRELITPDYLRSAVVSIFIFT